MDFIPCPFCGSTDIEHESMGGVRYARCQNCSCSAGHVFDFEDKPPYKESIFTKETVIKRWNTRMVTKEVVSG